ncbi:hypothetical protein HJG60_008617 [Phyllostomus discolor]|uniref:Uncharacterized protein n=1 Tax=Phyllostomus discolor TaxID=89673 RepID=A0A833Z517_9CHIR|nr:hypothetical protein HJG60_008617 [Phyllostomus discolor]
MYHLSVSPTSSLFYPVTSRIQVPPGWCQVALPGLEGEGACDLTLLSMSCSRHWAGCAAALVLVQIPGTLPSQHTLLAICYSMSLAIFCFQTSYKQGFHWLFTPFLRRSARCSSWGEGELGSPPTYLTTIFTKTDSVIVNQYYSLFSPLFFNKNTLLPKIYLR